MKLPEVQRSIKRRVPQPGTSEHRRWRKNVIAGRRQSRDRRLKAGVFTLPEIAERYGVPYSFVKRLADRRELAVIESGARRYVREAEADRAFGKPQGTAA